MRDIENYTKSYMSMPFLKENVKYRQECIMEQIMRYMHHGVLEIGCGMFPFFECLREDFDSYVVVEPSKVFVENARNRTVNRLKKIEVIEGYFEDESHKLSERKFDFIICSSLLHEVPDADCLLNAIYKVAHQNTIIHINVPNAMSMHRLIAKEMGLIDDGFQKSSNQKELQQRDIYDMQTLKEEVIKNGFCVMDEGSYFIKPFTHYQMNEMLDKGIINQDVITGLQRITKYFPEYGSEIFVNLRKGS